MQALVRDALAAWREAERLAAECEPGSARYIAMRDAAERLHAFYTDLTRTEPLEADVDQLRRRLTTLLGPITRPRGRGAPQGA